MSKKRVAHVLRELRKEFSREELLSVPGFYPGEGGSILFNLYGDYTLIPYYDGRGFITTIQGRAVGDQGGPKYKALSGSGPHLYVFPTHDSEEISGVCEGAVGAIVAAESGIAVASIAGLRTYRRWDDDLGEHRPLPELDGVDFAGREVLYIPDVDVKPKARAEVEKEVPKACQWLVEKQGGVGKVLKLSEGYKDFDEWLLSMPVEERAEAFEGLAGEAVAPGEFTLGPVEGGASEEEEEERDSTDSPAGEEEEGDHESADSPRQQDDQRSGETPQQDGDPEGCPPEGEGRGILEDPPGEEEEEGQRSDAGAPQPPGRKKTRRGYGRYVAYTVLALVAGAALVGLYPALAGRGGVNLPSVSLLDGAGAVAMVVGLAYLALSLKVGRRKGRRFSPVGEPSRSGEVVIGAVTFVFLSALSAAGMGRVGYAILGEGEIALSVYGGLGCALGLWGAIGALAYRRRRRSKHLESHTRGEAS